ncbi:MAG: FG-GAP-like repeat-containing protein, partial [Bacteroidota bacterium]
PTGDCGLCEGLELVVGEEVFAVDVSTGTFSLERTLANYNANNRFITSGQGNNIHFTSIADLDQDGDLDAIVTGHDNSTGKAEIWFWDVQSVDDTIKLIVPKPIGGANRWGPGRVNIADLDGDNDPDISFNNDDLFAYSLDFSTRQFDLLWQKNYADGSALTGTAVFDFNGDGSFEVVYRSTNELYIIDGATGDPYNTNHEGCPAGTYTDYPIVADINGDGITEIVVGCQPNASPIHNADNNGFLRLYGAAPGQKWVPARRLWNQHGYFNVNINDDLTVPRELQKHNAVFSDTLCDPDVNGNPVVGQVRPINSFLNQAPYLDESGCLEFPQSDLTFIENSLVMTAQPTCGETEIGLEIDIINSGDIIISGDLPVTYYDGDPELPSTTKLNTQIIPLNAPVGDTITYSLTAQATSTAFSPDGSFTLFVVINDDGTATPGINYPSTAVIEECTYSNNIASIDIEPAPNPITALAVSPNLKCVDSLTTNTGSASAFFVDSLGNSVTAGLTFYWFDEATPSGPADFTGPNYANLEEGFYSAYTENNDLGCNSDTVTVEILRVTEDSTLSARIDEVSVNTSCGTPNGELIAIVNPTDDNDSVGDDPNQYSFVWEVSVNLGEGNVISNSQNATGISSGPVYTVRVTDNSTGCDVLTTLDSTGTGIIYPTARVDIATDNNYCVGGNGFGLVSVGGDTTNFSFEWFDNEWKPAPDHSFARRNSMVGGDYFIIATANSSGCADSTSLSIADSLIFPSLTLYENIGNTSCDPNNTNGRLVVVSAEDTPYNWSDTVGSVTDNFSVAGSTTVVSDNRFQMTPDVNNQAGAAWFNDKVSLNQDFIFDFILNLGSRDGGGADGIGFVFHNDPDGRFAYGEAGQGMGASTLNPGVAIEFDSWDNGAGNPGPPENGFNDIPEDHVAVLNTATRNDYGTPLVGPIRMDPSIDNFEDGVDYEVQISWDASANRLLVIFDGRQLVDYTRDLVNDFFGGDPYVFFGFTSSTGGARNDQQVELVGIQATILSPETNTGLEWFDGDNTTVSLDGGAFDGDSLAFGLDAGVYTIKATNSVTGCVVDTTFTVADDRVIPTLNASRVTITPNSVCDSTAAVGALSVANNAVSPQPTQVNPFTYSYEWWIGDNAVGPSDIQGQNITGLLDRNYTLVVTNDSTSCPTAERTFTVGDTKVYPVISFTDSSYQSSCDNLNVNAFATGQATMPSGGEPSSGYTYAFYQGATTNSSALIVNDSSADQLAAGIYTLYAMNNATGCEGTGEITLIDSLIAPVLDTTLINVTNWTNCDTLSFNGEVAAGNGSITNYNGASYTFHWYDGANATAPIAFADSVYSGLRDGKYTLRVISDSTACESDPATVTVLQEAVYPQITFTDSSNQTSCTVPNAWAQGQATMPSGGEPAAGYTYVWYRGATIFGDTIVQDSSFFSQRQAAGIFTLLAINNSSQCEVIDQITLIDTLVAPIIDSASVLNTPWTNCDTTNYNGALTAGIAAIQNYNGAPYSFNWYDGGSASAPIASTDSLYDGLAPGTYTLVAISDSTSCESQPQSFVVDQSVVFPQITFTSFSDQTSCDTIPNGWALGQATMPSGGEPALGYAYAFYEGATTNMSALLANDSIVDSLAAGIYTLSAQNLETLCESTEQITLKDTLVTPIIDSISVVVTPWTNCDLGSLNGSLTAGVAAIQNANGGTYSFEWYDGPNAFSPIMSTDSVYDGLADGTYTLVATSDSTSCVSASQIFEVLQDVTYPVPTVNDEYQRACDPALANGWLSATAQEVDLSVPTNGYSFEWFNGQNTLLSSRLEISINPSDSSLLDSLSAGTYTLLVTNLDNACTDTTEWSVEDSLVDPTITNNLIDLTHYTICAPPNGAADATNAISQAVWGTPVNGYTYNWYEGDSALIWYIDSSATTAVYSGLLPGDYTLTVRNNDTGCESDESTVTILDSTATIIVDEFRTTTAGTCFGSTNPTRATAVISAETTPNANLAGFTYEWYRGQEPFPSPAIGSQTLVATDSSKTDTLSSDLYTVRMINLDNGCFLDSTFFIDFNSGHSIAFDSAVNSTICPDPITQFGNGELFTEIAINVGGADVTDYVFELYTGNNVTGTPDTTFETNVDSALINYPIFAHLAPGTYTMTIREDNTIKFPDNCPSEPVTFDILQD